MTLLVGMWMCVCAYARCCNVSFVFLLFFLLFLSQRHCFSKTVHLFIYLFFCCVGARTFRIANACVCVCVCMAAKSEQQQRPPQKKSETWLSLALQNAKDAVDAFLSPPRFFFPSLLFAFLSFSALVCCYFQCPKEEEEEKKKRSKCRRRRREKKKRERQRHFSSPFRSRMLQCRREAIGGGFKE